MFQRFAVAAAVLVVLALSGIFSLSWLVTRHLGAQGWQAHGVVVLGILLAVAGAARAFRAMRRFASPLGAVMDAADRVAEGDYATRVDARGPPPMQALARSFNTMTERLQHADQQRRDLMADLAHELRTPLAVLQGRLEGLIDGVYPMEHGQLERLLDQTRILSRLIEDLRILALSDAGVLALEREPTDLAGLLRKVGTSFEAQAARQGVSLHLELPAASLTLHIDAVRIGEVLANLISNALHHTPSGGSVSVKLASSAQQISISVSDTGVGIPAEDVALVFDRFYKGPHSRGSGLGLAIARNLVRAHGGDIVATSEPGKGTTVTFTLPSPAAS
jgi:signal transduction histidine kinase